jgi:hypothetical protein
MTGNRSAGSSVDIFEVEDNAALFLYEAADIAIEVH